MGETTLGSRVTDLMKAVDANIDTTDSLAALTADIKAGRVTGDNGEPVDLAAAFEFMIGMAVGLAGLLHTERAGQPRDVMTALAEAARFTRTERAAQHQPPGDG